MTTVITRPDTRQQALTMIAADKNPVRAARALEALQRLADRSYGYCTSCGLKIPDGRLSQYPERPLCKSCDPEYWAV